MLSVLPIADFALLWLLFYRRGADGRSSILLAALTWGAALLFMTEFLSLFNGLALPGLIAGWLGIGAATLILLRRTAARPYPKAARLSAILWLLVAGIAAVVLVIGLTAVLSLPNNWDSMTYHLGRVVHWVHNASIANYPTNIQRQLYEAPLAEFILTHLHILSGGDRLATLVQWFALIGNAVVVSLIAQALGASRRGQIVAAAVAVTLPMAILEGSSTQNDLVSAFWMACTAYFVIRAARGDRTAQTIFAVGAAAGLSLMTKATAYLYLLPFGLWFVIVLLRRRPTAREWLRVVIAGILIVVMNAGYLSRNLTTYQSLVGPDGHFYANQVMSPAYFASNVVRNVALHVSIAKSLSDRFRVGVRVNDVIDRIHALLGVSKDDPRTTIWYTGVSFGVWSISYDEDQSSAPAQLLIGLAAVVLFAFRLLDPRFRASNRLAALYLGAMLVSFALFCLILKVQPWNSRLHLPGFILMAAFSGFVLDLLFPAAIGIAAAVALLGLSMAPLLHNHNRPLEGAQTIFNTDRRTLLFTKQPELQPDYEQAVAEVEKTGCTRIGLYFGEDSWEYPLWVLSRDSGYEADFEHVHTRFLSSDFQPCAVIRDTAFNHAAQITLGGEMFTPVWTGTRLDVLTIQDQPAGDGEQARLSTPAPDGSSPRP